MKYTVVILACLSVALVACTPYPRYSTHAANTPMERGPRVEMYHTDDFISLGLILQDYLGTPYGARTRVGQGLDCSLFTQQVFWKFNRTELPRTAEDQFRAGQPVSTRRLEFGDLVFYRTDGRTISHVGIYVGYNEFMHVSSSRGVIVSSMGEQYWAERYVGARRILSLRGPSN